MSSIRPHNHDVSSSAQSAEAMACDACCDTRMTQTEGMQSVAFAAASAGTSAPSSGQAGSLAEPSAHHATPAKPTKAPAQSESFMELTLFNLFWIFVIASVIGLVAETCVSTLQDGFLKNRAGLIWGPFSPLYGLGAVLMTIALNDFKGRSPLLLFTVAAFVGGLLEYFAGLFWEKAFGIVAWSYIDQPLNFGGYTCAGIMIVWGLAGLAWCAWGIPAMRWMIERIPQRSGAVITAALAVFLAADIAMTLFAFNFWFERLSGEPVTTPAQVYFDEHYGNDWMANRFQTMSMWTELAHRDS